MLARERAISLLLLLFSTCPSNAQMTEQEAAGINGAAMFFAMGSIAYGECPKLGYQVSASAWGALLEKAAPGVQAKDFVTGGKFSEVARNSLAYVGSIQGEAGLATWCAYVAAWAKVAHPAIWQKLIKK